MEHSRFAGCASAVLAGDIRRLDGTRITTEAASQLARETLEKHGVTGAQIAVVDRGKLVSSDSNPACASTFRRAAANW